MPTYDLIGDIHGHANELKLLLEKLGYTPKGKSFVNPSRTAIFIGDYIDRGLQIKETLEIVRSMVDSGNALAIMGNHEFNAICYHLPDGKGGFLRKHTGMNAKNHQTTLNSFSQTEWDEWIKWLMRLPITLELPEFNVVHACWDKKMIDFLDPWLSQRELPYEFFRLTSIPKSKEMIATEILLKGPELPLISKYIDIEGNERDKVRFKWWIDPIGKPLKDISISVSDQAKAHNEFQFEYPIPSHISNTWDIKKPVFFGHYWLEGDPIWNSEYACCLDYSVAKNGKLVAYSIDSKKFTCVDSHY